LSQINKTYGLPEVALVSFGWLDVDDLQPWLVVEVIEEEPFEGVTSFSVNSYKV